jgi:hypothetical protein
LKESKPTEGCKANGGGGGGGRRTKEEEEVGKTNYKGSTYDIPIMPSLSHSVQRTQT